jgi:hypothetical protein
MKIAVVGGGSTYTPELVSGLSRERDRIDVTELALHDIDAERRDVVGEMAARMLEKQGFGGKLVVTSDLDLALDGADFVLVQIRVGGQTARLSDETIPLACGCIGQETTGAGGLAKALRTVPVVLEIADRVRERAISTLPPDYAKVEEPETGGDMKDWPRIAKLQTDLLVHALATGQTRVASYMLTKCQGLSRFPWLGYTSARHHDYTHADGKAPGADGVEGQRVLRDICKWHVDEFAYLVAKLKSIPEGDGTVFDHCCLAYVHEHAEANPHKNSGLAITWNGEGAGAPSLEEEF